MDRNNHRTVYRAPRHRPPDCPPELHDIITGDPFFREILARLPIWAASDLPVLLTGEPGTGKELVAKALYALNPHRHSWQRLNCAALTEELAGSELFGHLRGAFTGAHSARTGKFRLAHRGTLFLDEVGDLPLSVQAKLLRAVEQGEIEPVGGDEVVVVDVRLVAATNRDLPPLIGQGRFRQDLYDRLAVLEIRLPPLRRRGEDIVLLSRHFAQEAARRYGRALPVEINRAALQLLTDYGWPGNIRELKNVITRAVLLKNGGPINQGEIYFSPRPQPMDQATRPAAGESLAVRPSRSRLEELLVEEGGNITALSRRLQVCTKTVYRWLRSHRIDLLNFREMNLA